MDEGVNYLLAAVLADPADDLARLAYADWLEERGAPGDAPRAELIRLQLALHGLRSNPNGHRGVKRWKRRVAELFALHGASWAPVPGLLHERPTLGQDMTLRPSVTNHYLHLRWRRGFVAWVGCHQSDWLACGPPLARSSPLEEVRLFGLYPVCLRQRWWWLGRQSYAEVTPDNCSRPRLLPELWSSPPFAPLRRPFDTEKEAHAALSACLVDWARGGH